MENMAVYNTVLFCIAPLFLMLLLTDDDDEDQGPGGGLMQPAYERN